MRKGGSETADEVALVQGLHLAVAVGFHRQRHEILPVSRAHPRFGLQIKAGMDNPLPGGQRLGGEETGAALLHRQQRFAIDRPFEAKAEEIGLILAEELIDADIVADDLPRHRQRPMEGDHRIKEAVDRLSLGDKVDAEVGGEEEVGLAGLDRDTGGDAAAIKIPAVRCNIMLGDDATMRH